MSATPPAALDLERLAVVPAGNGAQALAARRLGLKKRQAALAPLEAAATRVVAQLEISRAWRSAAARTPVPADQAD
jgi:hypothetical protein